MNFDKWKGLLRSNNSSDRSHAADELPVDGNDVDIETLLINTLQDEDAFVRTCAVDSLSCFDTSKAREAVRNLLSTEGDLLAKSFAVSTLGAIGDFADLGLLTQIFEDSRSDKRVRVHCSSAIIELTHRTHLPHLLNCTVDASILMERPTIGCAANLLADSAEIIQKGLHKVAEWSQLHPSKYAEPDIQDALQRLEALKLAKPDPLHDS
jgi:hypothetical protein